MKLSVLTRKAHRWGALVIALPLALVIGTGILLQLKKQLTWVQPPEHRGRKGDPSVSWEQLLAACVSVPEAGVQSWSDIDRVDFRPGKNLIKVSTVNHIELQLDASTGAVLQVATRRSDAIESLHDGSWFGNWTKLGLFLPCGIVLAGLWSTGIYLFFYPRWVKWRRRR